MRLFRPLLFLLLFGLTNLSAQETIWPGDVNNNGIVNEADLLFLGFGFGEVGPARKTVSAAWQPEVVTATWATSLAGTLNLAYADCNGDGIVNEEDVQVIRDNFGRTHSDVVFTPDEVPVGVPGLSPAFSVPESESLVVTPNTRTLSVPINLGNETFPVTNLVGISFYIKTNPEAFNVQETRFTFSQEGWLPIENSTTITRQLESGRSAVGDLVVAYSKTNRLPSSGNGLIGNIDLTPSFVVINDVPDFKVTIDSIILFDDQLNKVPVLGTEIVFDAVGFQDSTMVDSTICQGDVVVFNDSTLTESGTYRDTFMNSVGGDSIIILNLSVNDTFQTSLSETLCPGDTLNFNGQGLTEAGTYRDTLTASNGCDSFLVLDLTVLDTFRTEQLGFICAGDSFAFNNQSLAQSGTYRDTLMATNGCDSFIVLNLVVTDTFQTMLDEMICAGATIMFNGQALSESGTYRDTLMAVSGCDSFIVLNLSIMPAVETVLSDTICQGEAVSFGDTMVTEAGQYRDTLSTINSCDSIVVLDLVVLDTLQTVLDRTICAGDSFLFNEQNLTESGVYRDTLGAGNGCSQYIILNLTVNDTLQTVLDRTICEGDNFLFNNAMLTESGTYRDTLVAGNGCDQYIILNLTVTDRYETNLSATICAGEDYAFNNQQLTVSGTYQLMLQAANGCDSIINLALTVLDPIATMLEAQICAGSTYDFNGQPLDVAGVYRDTMMADNGCDSTIVLNLSVANNEMTTINQTICEGSSFAFAGENLNEAGIYRDTMMTTNGCDSIITLDLKVSDRYETENNQVICEGESFFFNERNLDISGMYQDTFVAVNGCDSLVTLNLMVAATAFTRVQESVCAGGSYFFNGQDLTEAGTYLDTLSTVNGCDSFVELSLRILPMLESTSEETICFGDTLNFYNFTLTETNSYMVILRTESGCDSMVILNLLVLDPVETTLDTTICPGKSYDFAGGILTEANTYSATFTAANGCDSIVVVNLSVADSSDAACIISDVEEEQLAPIEIYPNPVRDQLIIKNDAVELRTIRLLNLAGQTVWQQSIPNGNASDQQIIDMGQLTPGVYWLLLQTERGIRQEKIVKL
ncbi:MAG: T9SS type A sorting domain-containing protein [Bacteroidota bacterium]